MKRIQFFGLFVFSIFFLVFASVADPKVEQEDSRSRIINVYRKTSNPHTNGIHNLVVPSALEEVESLSIDPVKKQFFLMYKGQDPIKLENAFQPQFPWGISQDQLVKFINAHTFFLKQFEDGSCKFEMKVPGLGGGFFSKAVDGVKHGIDRAVNGPSKKSQKKAEKKREKRRLKRQAREEMEKYKYNQRKFQKAEQKVHQAEVAHRSPKKIRKYQKEFDSALHNFAVASSSPLLMTFQQASLASSESAPLKGVHNPKTNGPRLLGVLKHKEWDAFMRKIPGSLSNRIVDLSGKLHIADGVRLLVHELKPGTVSGVKQGLKQLARYQEAFKKQVFLWLYDNGKGIPIDEIMHKNFRNDPIVKAVKEMQASQKISPTILRSGSGSRGRGGGPSLRRDPLFGMNIGRIPRNPMFRERQAIHYDIFGSVVYHSGPSTLDLTFPEGPLNPLYTSQVIAGKRRAVIDFFQIIRMPKTTPSVKDVVYVQVNDVALDPEPLLWHLTEETLSDLPDDEMPEYPAYVEWVRKTDHANALCHLIADVCPQEGFLYHHNVSFDSKDCATGIEEACRNNVHLVNLSVSLSNPISEPFKAALRRAKRQGMGFVVAGGNENLPFTESPFHRSLAEFALAEMDGHLLFVTGTQYTFDGKEVKYADGNMPFFASSITLSAPASQIHVPSTRAKGEEVSQGTSLPTAMVTGAAARLKKQYFALSIKEVFQFLREGARKTYLGLAELLPPDIFGCGVLDIESTQALVQKRADLEPVSHTFKHLRSIGNGTSDEELAGHLLKDKGWDALAREEKAKTVANVVEGKERSDLNELLTKQNYPLAYRSIRVSGNTASDEEVVRFLLESNGFKGWGGLSPASQAWVVAKIIAEAEKSGLKLFLKGKDYPADYLSIKASGNTSSDEEIVRFLLESNGFKDWDSLPTCDKIWVVSKITHEAEGRTLEAFLDLQDYPAALHSIKASGNPSSDAEIVDFLLKNNGYKNLDKLSPGQKGWAVAKVVREEERRALIEFLILKDYPAVYRSIRASGNKASDEEVVRHILESNGYKGWEKLSPGTPAWVVGLVLRAIEKQELLEFISEQDYAATYRSIRASGNKASDVEVVKFLLENNGFKGWDDLFPDNQEWVVGITLRGAERKTLVDILSLTDYPAAYRSIRASGNKASDEEVTKHLLASNGFEVWDSLFPENQEWVVGITLRGAERKTLVDILNLKDYAAAYRSIRASGNKVSDEEVTKHLLASNGFEVWDSLFPENQEWVASWIIGEATGRILEEVINRQDYLVIYRSLRASGNKASDEEVTKHLLASNGFKVWDSLFPQDQAWAIAVITGKAS